MDYSFFAYLLVFQVAILEGVRAPEIPYSSGDVPSAVNVAGANFAEFNNKQRPEIEQEGTFIRTGCPSATIYLAFLCLSDQTVKIISTQKAPGPLEALDIP